MNHSVINIDGIHASVKTFQENEYSVDWYSILTIRDEHGNEIEIIIKNGKISNSKHK